MMAYAVKDRRLLVTGAAQGLGREITLYLAKKGAHLVLWDVNLTELEKTASLAREFNVEVESREVNLADPKDIAAAAEASPPIWGVINNAGIVEPRMFLESSDERNELTFKVNTFAAFYTAKHFLPSMIANNSGAFVVVSSSASYIGAPKMATYAASKAASRMFIEALAHEITPQAPGVHLSVVCPSHIDTGLFKGFASVPLNPTLKPDDLAKLIVDEAIENCNPLVVTPFMTRISASLRGLMPEGIWRKFSGWQLAHLMDGVEKNALDGAGGETNRSRL